MKDLHRDVTRATTIATSSSNRQVATRKKKQFGRLQPPGLDASMSAAWSTGRQTFDLRRPARPSRWRRRTYRMRCVEGWSMVIPWVRLPHWPPFSDQVEPLGSAKSSISKLWASGGDVGVQRGIFQSMSWALCGACLASRRKPRNPLPFSPSGTHTAKPCQNQNGPPVRSSPPWKYGLPRASSQP